MDVTKSWKTKTRRYVAAVLAVAFLMPAPVLAAGDTEIAKQHYQDALQAFEKGDLEEALKKFQMADVEMPNLVFKYNQILVLEELQRYQDALDLLEISQGPMQRDEQARFADIDQVKARLEKGLEAQQQAELEAQQQAELEAQKQAELEAQKQAELEAQQQAEREAAASVEPPPAQGASGGPSVVSWSLMGAGVVGLGVGTLFASGVMVGDDLDRVDCVNDEIDDGSTPRDAAYLCSESEEYDRAIDEYNTAADRVDFHQTMAIVGLASGAALLGTGVVLWLVSDETDASDASALRFSPWVGQGSAGAVLGGSF